MIRVLGVTLVLRRHLDKLVGILVAIVFAYVLPRFFPGNADIALMWIIVGGIAVAGLWGVYWAARAWLWARKAPPFPDRLGVMWMILTGSLALLGLAGYLGIRLMR